jgi:hypothetical protein
MDLVIIDEYAYLSIKYAEPPRPTISIPGRIKYRYVDEFVPLLVSLIILIVRYVIFGVRVNELLRILLDLEIPNAPLFL